MYRAISRQTKITYDIRSYSGPYSVRLRENTDQNNYEYGHFSRRVSNNDSDNEWQQVWYRERISPTTRGTSPRIKGNKSNKDEQRIVMNQKMAKSLKSIIWKRIIVQITIYN